MHIPDGLLKPNILVATWIAAIIISFSLKKVSIVLKDRLIPLMGVLAAFIFVVQIMFFF